MTTRMVHCVKLGRLAPGQERQRYPGELGKRIYEEISEEAWQGWLRHQTMLINEYRLSLIDPKAQALLKAEMEKYLFGDGSAAPSGYVPPKD